MTVVFLTLARSALTSRWALWWDDGLWVGMVRRWCAGAHLYADVWESKGPLFFLWMKPMCLASPGHGAIVTPQELGAFWGPLLALYAASGAVLAQNFCLRRPVAFLFGVCVVVLAWTASFVQFFSSESLAGGFVFLALALLSFRGHSKERFVSGGVAIALCSATLCNWRCAFLLPIYFFSPGLTRIALKRDLLNCFVLAAFVLLATLGTDKASYQWLWKTLSFVRSYPPISPRHLAQLVGENFLFGLPGLWSILLTPIESMVPFFSKHRWVLQVAISLALVPSFVLLSKKIPASLFTLMATLISVYGSGIVFDHTFALVIPWALFLLAFQLSRGGTPGRVAIGLWCALALRLEWYEPSRTAFWDYSRPKVLEEREAIVSDHWRYLGGRKWVSLLSNGVPVLLVPNLSLPENRMFHSYCHVFPSWSADQIRTSIEQGGVRVALHDGLSGEQCAPHQMVQYVRQKCVSVGWSRGSDFGRVEYLDCPPS